MAVGIRKAILQITQIILGVNVHAREFLLHLIINKLQIMQLAL